MILRNMRRTRQKSFVWLLFLTAIVQRTKGQATNPLTNLFGGVETGKCAGGLRCGFNGYTMHLRGTQNTASCVEICASVPIFQFAYECGACEDDGIPPTDAPTAAPAPMCTTATGRCLVGLGFAMYRGIQDSVACVQICSFYAFPRTGFQCGYCSSNGSPAPTNAPVAVSTTQAPIDTPTSVAPVVSPTTSVPTNAGTSAPTMIPTTLAPTAAPNDTSPPTVAPTTATPTTLTPTTLSPTMAPTEKRVYEITLDLVMDDTDKPLFTDAALRWQAVIVGDVADVPRSDLGTTPLDGCSFPDVIDDLYICGVLEPIDGPGNVAGSARPTQLRRGSGQVISGDMRFDTDDLVNARELNLMDTLIAHEMGHVIGIGTIWDNVGVAVSSTVDPTCPYTGEIATREYEAISGCDEVPIEQTGGTGTQCKHWADSCLGSELMTGDLNFDFNPLSRVTVGSLEDLGYEVDYNNADPFGQADLDPTCLCRRRRRTLWDGRHGEVTPLGDAAIHESSPPSKRVLQDDLRQTAIEYGLNVLRKTTLTEREGFGGEDVIVLDNVISVLMRDGDHYFGVLVVRSENE